MNVNDDKKDVISHGMLGKSILVGLTYRDQDGNLTEQRQIFGEISSISEEETTMEVDEADGTFWKLPFYPRTILEAPRGVYKCNSSDLQIENPDLLTSWSIIVNKNENEGPDWQPNYHPISSPVNPREWEFEYEADTEYQRERILAKGNQYIGKRLLVGQRYYVSDGEQWELLKQEQFHGEIVRVNPSEGIVIMQPNGEEMALPPDLSLLEPSIPGAEYKLRSTGEIIKDADYITSWEVYHPRDEE